DVVSDPTGALRVGRPAAVLDGDHAQQRADPEPAAAVQVQAHDAWTRQLRSVRAIEHRELDAVETDQAVERAEPEVTVRRLDHRRGGVLGQPLLRLPDVD